MLEKLLLIDEVSKQTGLPILYISKCCRNHPDRIPKSFVLHGQRRWKESDVEEWMNQNKDKLSH